MRDKIILNIIVHDLNVYYFNVFLNFLLLHMDEMLT